MKKKLAAVFVVAVMAILTVISPLSVSADEIGQADMVGDDYVVGIYDSEPVAPGGITTFGATTGLISANSLKLSVSGKTLYFTGITTGSSSVTKVGFTYLTLQRKVSGGSWQDYYYWTNYYTTSTTTYTFQGSMSVSGGYYYRLICNHYAEKTTLLVFKDYQNKYNETSQLWVA